MDSPLLIALSLGVFFSFFAPFVISQQNVIPESPSPPVFSPPPPPPPVFSPPPPPPPPMSPAPPPPPPLPPSHHHFRPPRTKIPRRRPPPPPPPPPPPKDKAQAGLIVGLVFLVIAFLMQIGVVAYLVIKRRQLLKD